MDQESKRNRYCMLDDTVYRRVYVPDRSNDRAERDSYRAALVAVALIVVLASCTIALA